MQDGVGGLQVRRQGGEGKEGEWVDVPAVEVSRVHVCFVVFSVCVMGWILRRPFYLLAIYNVYLIYIHTKIKHKRIASS